MLILTRRVGETLMIGDSVTVTVLGVKEIRCALALPRLRMLPCIAKKSISASSAVTSRLRPVRITTTIVRTDRFKRVYVSPSYPVFFAACHETLRQDAKTGAMPERLKGLPC